MFQIRVSGKSLFHSILWLYRGYSMVSFLTSQLVYVRLFPVTRLEWQKDSEFLHNLRNTSS